MERVQPPSEREIMLMVHRQMRLLVGTHPELDDLTQTALEQILKANFEGRSKFSTFTQAVCYRVWMKHLRGLYRWRARFSFSSSEEELEQVDTTTAESALETRARYERLYQALEKVSPKRRAVVVLHDIEGMTAASISEIVGAGIGTVRSRLRDGRKKLAEQLKDDPYFGELSEGGEE